MYPPPLLKQPPDKTLHELNEQAVVGWVRGDDYIGWLRRYSALLIAELQLQLYAAARMRQASARQRRKTPPAPRPERPDDPRFSFAGQCTGQAARSREAVVVPDQVAASPQAYDGLAVPVRHADGAKGWGIVRAEQSAKAGVPVVALRR